MRPGRRRRSRSLRLRGSAPAACWRLVLTVTVLACYLGVVTPGEAAAPVYLNQWAVQIDGGPGVADAVAADNGFRNLGQVRFSLSVCHHHPVTDWSRVINYKI